MARECGPLLMAGGNEPKAAFQKNIHNLDTLLLPHKAKDEVIDALVFETPPQ